MALKKRKKGRSISVDMEGVTSGGFSVPDADYKVKVVEVTEEEGADSGEPYLSWELEIIEGKHKGAKLYHITSLQKQALFNLRRTLEACGMEIPDSAMDLDLDELTDLTLGVTTEQEEYKGKKKSKVIDTFNPDAPDEEDEDQDEEDEAPKKKKKKVEEDDGEEDETPKKKKKVEEDEEEEEEAPKKKKKKVEEEDEEEEEDPAPKKKKKVEEDEEDEEEDEAPKKKKKKVEEEEEEEEEDEKPAPKKKKKADPEFEEGQRVSFDDEDGNTLKGKIESLDDEAGTAKVNVKGEVWEVEISDLSVV